MYWRAEAVHPNTYTKPLHHPNTYHPTKHLHHPNTYHANTYTTPTPPPQHCPPQHLHQTPEPTTCANLLDRNTTPTLSTFSPHLTRGMLDAHDI